jgi:hypothetical protein
MTLLSVVRKDRALLRARTTGVVGKVMDRGVFRNPKGRWKGQSQRPTETEHPAAVADKIGKRKIMHLLPLESKAASYSYCPLSCPNKYYWNPKEKGIK